MPFRTLTKGMNSETRAGNRTICVGVNYGKN